MNSIIKENKGMKPNSRQVDESEKQLEELMLQDRMQEIDMKLLVLSGKGGVGKSMVAASLARSLAGAGKKVGLLDVDIHGPSIPKLFGLEDAKIQVNNHQMEPVRVSENLSVMSIGFLLPAKNEAVIWRGPMKYSFIRQALKDVAWGKLDCLVIDSPPGTGDEPLSVAQLAGSPSAAVIVTTPQELAIADVRRCVTFCNSLSLPVAGMVENMSGFLCPTCGSRIDLFKAGGGENLAKEMNVRFLGKVPFDPLVMELSDVGKSFAETNRRSPAEAAMKSIVEKVIAVITKNK